MLKINFTSETGNDLCTPGMIAEAISNITNMSTNNLLAIADHLNIIARCRCHTEITKCCSDTKED